MLSRCYSTEQSGPFTSLYSLSFFNLFAQFWLSSFMAAPVNLLVTSGRTWSGSKDKHETTRCFVSPDAGLGLDQLVTMSAKLLSSRFPHFHSPLVSHPALTPDCSHRFTSPTDIHTCSLPHQPSSAHTGQPPVIPCKIIYCAPTAESQPKFFSGDDPPPAF